MQFDRCLKPAASAGISIAGIMLSGLLLSGAAQARSSYLTAVINDCGNSNYDCSTCHTNPPALNSTGETFRSSGRDTASICPPPQQPTCTDADGDNYAIEGGGCGAIDCNDRNPAVNPGAVENCTNGSDDNCNGLIDTQDPAAVGCPTSPTCTDDDNDGYAFEGGACGPADCDDSNPAVNPGAVESCTNGTDDNCNGLIDAQDPAAVSCTTTSTTCTDADGDGYAIEGGGCGPVDSNDSNPAVNPEATEDCSNGIDDNGNDLIDGADPTCAVCMSTTSIETGRACTDGRDNDCNGSIDCADSSCSSNRRCRTAREHDDEHTEEDSSEHRRSSRRNRNHD